jgi:hypothetical protein
VAGGFALGPWTETGSAAAGTTRSLWVRVDPDGQKQTLYATEFGVQGKVLDAINTATPSRLVLVRYRIYDGYWSAILDEGGTDASTVAKLLDGEFSKFTGRRGGPSLDGQRGLFMIYDELLQPPRLAMYAADGTPVGDVFQTTAAGGCYNVFPTEHGAMFMSQEGSAFRFIEFSAAGNIALDITIPFVGAVASVGCPNPVRTDTGFAYLAFESTEADGAGWFLHRVARDGTNTLEPWFTLLGCQLTSVGLAIKGDTAIATCAQTYQTTIVKRTNGQDQRFPLERNGPQILSEPGTLFLDINVLLPAGVGREILEIACVD